MRDAEEARDGRVSVSLADHPVAHVDKQNNDIRGGHPSDGVARVLLVAGAVRQDEFALVSGEIAVCDVDGDALLALGAKAVDQERQVRLRQAPGFRRTLNRFVLVTEDRFRVVKQAADERGLAIVDGTCGAEPDGREFVIGWGGGGAGVGGRGGRRAGVVGNGVERNGCAVRHQKYPSFFLSSMEDSDNLSSARVAPRSVVVERRISSIMSALVRASDSTAPVHDMSPTVR